MTTRGATVGASVVGVDLGGTKISAGLVDPEGRVTHRISVATPANDGASAVVDAVSTVVDSVRSARGDVAVAGVGIGSAGVIDPITGDVVSATDAIPSWAGTRLRSRLHERLGLPVAALNDVHAHAFGESRLGAGRDHGTALMIAVGTGVGGALVVNGALQLGRHGAAGHYGHLASPEAVGIACSCGGSGHVEAIASGPAIHRAYLRDGGDPRVADTRAVFARVPSDPIAAAAVRASARAVGILVGGLVNATDPDVVILSGGIAATGEIWWGDVRRAARAELPGLVRACPIVPAELGHDSAIVGAALHFRHTTGALS